MKIAIIGAGFAGLSAGYYLSKAGVKATVFEAEDRPGGLAVGFKEKGWDWTLEKHYHHWFTNDDAVLSLAKEIGHEVLTKRPKTSTFVNGKVYQLDSPLSLVLFDQLSLIDRIRTGMVLAYLKATPRWKPLEKVTAKKFLIKYGGVNTWKVLWEPLFEKKFEKYADKIPASWFWARIKKRTASLAYPKGGFFEFTKTLDNSIRRYGGEIHYQTRVEEIANDGEFIRVKTSKGEQIFNKVICTLPSPLFAKVTKDLPKKYVEKLLNLKGIGAVNLVLSLNKQFLEDGTYWLNINARHFPFLAVVEHTNFMDRKNYGGENLVYVGNYLPHEHEYFKKEAVDLIREFYPYLSTVNPKFDKDWINDAWVFKAPFAQPIIPLNYSKKIPDMKTPLDGLYLANIQQVYPWDRGTNYAVELGKQVADMAIKET